MHNVKWLPNRQLCASSWRWTRPASAAVCTWIRTEKSISNCRFSLRATMTSPRASMCCQKVYPVLVDYVDCDDMMMMQGMIALGSEFWHTRGEWNFEFRSMLVWVVNRALFKRWREYLSLFTNGPNNYCEVWEIRRSSSGIFAPIWKWWQINSVLGCDAICVWWRRGSVWNCLKCWLFDCAELFGFNFLSPKWV